MSAFVRVFAIFLTLFLLQWMPGTVTPSQAQEPDPVTEIMSRMSVEDKVGQLFIVPFVGANTNPDSDIWQLLTEYRVGGAILLAANSNFNNDPSAPRQISELVNSLQTTSFNTNGLPLFVAIDHEGDDFPFTRITKGVTPIPSLMAIGATWDTSYAEAVGLIVGEDMAAMGINMLLGPSVDVLNDPRPTGRGDIGIRVFGGDPYWVSRMGRSYIRGVHAGSQGQVVTVAKHFPGHGGSDRLPDNEVATVDKSLQELRRIELPPFFNITAEQPDDPLGTTDALMSSHIRYRGFQGDIRQFTAPISFDAEGMRTLTSLPQIAQWRDRGGLIVSDALGVPAVRKHFDPTLTSFPHRRIAKEAFLAGNDVLSLVQFDLKSIWPDQFANIKDTIFFFRTEYINNPAFADRVDATVARILRMKLKLYPELTLDALNQDPNQTLEVTVRPRPVVNEIARQSLTLLYPSADELRLRVPGPPRSDENILVVVDTRLARECFTDDCQPKELFLARNDIRDTILRLYGPGATGQIQPEQINTITFSELKSALAGSISGLTESGGAGNESSPLIQVPPEEVRQHIQAADWLIFATLDLNVSRYSDSDALKLFLAQESGTLRDKISLVMAFNAPYYLDTTEITKLTAYYGVYSKTQPHIEAAVRALFGEASFLGASPVSVEGIGYKLVDVLAPDPEQSLVVEPLQISPENKIAPVTIRVRAGPVFDHNGHIVPDETHIELKARLAGRDIASALADTQDGLAEATLTLTEPGNVEILAVVGQNILSEVINVSVEARPTPTASPTSLPTATIIPTETPTSMPTATSAPAATATPLPIMPQDEPLSSPPSSLTSQPRSLDGIDLLSALGATLLAGLLGFWLGQQFHKTLSRRLRVGLWGVIGGLSAYLLYGAGLLRPEQWFFAEPNLLAGRLSVAGLAFVFAMVALGLSNRNLAARKT